MRSYDDYRRILELWQQGFNKKEIERLTAIPRGTVVDCIRRFGSLKGLEDNKQRASKTTPDLLLNSIYDTKNIQLQQAYVYVLGIYLGDGYIVRNHRVYYLRIFLDTAYPNIIEHCYQSIQILLPDNKVNVMHSTAGNNVEVICTYKFWPDLFPQHGQGAKHEREIRLEEWQQKIVDTYPLEFFRGLYHSDGSRFSNVVKGKDYPRYCLTNYSTDIQSLFCAACDRLGLRWTVKARYGKNADIFISKREDVAFLDQHIGPKS
jgi:hypothetical protein